MIPSTVFKRRPARRARNANNDSSVALVVGLMMALVFAPVLGLHIAANAVTGHGPSAAATNPVSLGVATERRARPG